MPAQPAALIQESIDKLEQLSALLAAEMRARAPGTAQLPPELRLGKEVLLSINVLLPKLHAAHRCQGRTLAGPVQPGTVWSAPLLAAVARGCPTCED